MTIPAGPWYIDDLLTFSVNVHDPESAAGVDADSSPSYRVYEDENGTPILTGTMALLDSSNTVGCYSEQLTLSAANGLEVGKSYTIYKSITVGGVVGTDNDAFKVIATPSAGASVGDIADAVWDEATSGHTTAGTFGKLLADMNTTLSGLAAASAAAVWNSVTASYTTAGTFGKLIIDIYSAFGAVAAAAASAVWAAGTRTLTDKTNFKLASDGLDSVAAPADIANDTAARATFMGMIRAVFNRFYNEVNQNTASQTVKNDSGTVHSTMSVSSTTSTQTKGKSS